jgi:hypothetical protein
LTRRAAAVIPPHPARSRWFCRAQGFDNSANQESIYAKVGKDGVERVRQGFNATIVAYGQTGSGKTHTMFGPDNVRKELAKKSPDLGIVPRACAAHSTQTALLATIRASAMPGAPTSSPGCRRASR